MDDSCNTLKMGYRECTVHFAESQQLSLLSLTLPIPCRRIFPRTNPWLRCRSLTKATFLDYTYLYYSIFNLSAKAEICDLLFSEELPRYILQRQQWIVGHTCMGCESRINYSSVSSYLEEIFASCLRLASILTCDFLRPKSTDLSLVTYIPLHHALTLCIYVLFKSQHCLSN